MGAIRAVFHGGGKVLGGLGQQADSYVQRKELCMNGIRSSAYEKPVNAVVFNKCNTVLRLDK